MQEGQLKKHFTFFSLYIAQSVPMSLFSTLLPVLMRQDNFSLTSIGLLQLIKLPWIAKFLWAPLVDKQTFGLFSYKRWIFYSEIIYALLILMIAFLDLKVNFILIMCLIILSFVASATQDIATDALTAISFKRKDRSWGNSMQSMGSFAGSLVGGGLLLVLYKYIGWTLMLVGLSVFLILMLLPLASYRDRRFAGRMDCIPISMKDILLFFKQPNIFSQLVFLFLFNGGLIGTLAMMKPWMVDLGYPIGEIGLIFSIFGSLSGCLGSFLSGYTIRRIGRESAAILYACSILFTTALFFSLSSMGMLVGSWLYVAIFCLWFCYGLSTVLVYTIAMDYVRVGREGTDFTLQIVLMHVGSMIIAIGSGKLADKMGYSTLFLFEISLALLSLLYVSTHFKKILRWI
ncbi:MFS transporter [uncultured Bacteroides sp.]|uniref:MFS transporter n=1 Tax=uncultured Bacteroides sp. TaxID=162156 RepID=UPI002AAB7177|nr:MFS transporter [uncultured Bacteroides sp.]